MGIAAGLELYRGLNLKYCHTLEIVADTHAVPMKWQNEVCSRIVLFQYATYFWLSLTSQSKTKVR